MGADGETRAQAAVTFSDYVLNFPVEPGMFERGT